MDIIQFVKQKEKEGIHKRLQDMLKERERLNDEYRIEIPEFKPVSSHTDIKKQKEDIMKSRIHMISGDRKAYDYTFRREIVPQDLPVEINKIRKQKEDDLKSRVKQMIDERDNETVVERVEENMFPTIEPYSDLWRKKRKKKLII
jgi:hypothetical protein